MSNRAPREEIRLVRPFVTTDNTALDTSSIMPLAESDGTLRNQLVGWDGSSQTRILTETSGTLKQMLIGLAGATETRIKVETTGEQDIVFHGKDSGGTIDPLRTNDDKQLQVETIDEKGSQTPKILGTADPAATTNTNLYTVPAATSTLVTMLSAANRSAITPVAIRIGIDVGGGGTNTPGTSEWIYFDFSVAANTTEFLIPPGGLWLSSTDDLVVFAGTQNIAFVATGIEYA